MLDLQASFAELQKENTRLKEDNRQLKSAADIKKTIVFHDHACWRQREVKVSPDHDDDSLRAEQYELREEGPYCASCWTNGKLHRAQVYTVKDDQVEFCCKRHKGYYYFQVPERLVKIGDISSYRKRDVKPTSGFRGGPDSWMS